MYNSSRRIGQDGRPCDVSAVLAQHLGTVVDPELKPDGEGCYGSFLDSLRPLGADGQGLIPPERLAARPEAAALLGDGTFPAEP